MRRYLPHLLLPALLHLRELQDRHGDFLILGG